MAVPSVFTDMLRSFVSLGRSLNLTQSVNELGVTRQTINRHIKELEAKKGVQLFELVDRQYRLTETGKASLETAEKLLQQSAEWMDGRTLAHGDMVRTELQMGDKGWFNAQQHPVNRIWTDAPPLLRRSLRDWGTAEAQLEHRAFKKIRPYRLIYRQHGSDWLCIEVGESSSYATWLGWSRAKSSVGRALASNLAYVAADRYITNTYMSVTSNGGHWYDHVNACFVRFDGEKPHHVNYQRLVSACRFPDGEPAISVIVARTNAISINQLDPNHFKTLPDKDLMEFEI